MAHEFESGYVMFKPAWHGLATVRMDWPGSWKEAAALAGMDWEPVDAPVYDVVARNPDGSAQVHLIDGYKQIRRSDTGTLMNIAADTYQIIPHAEMGAIFELLMDLSDGEILYETAGVLYGGRKVWALARLGKQFQLPGDPSGHQPYIAVLNSHDGTAALQVLLTMIRIVCANTYHAAQVNAAATGAAFAFKHTLNWRDRVEDAKRALKAAGDQKQATIKAATDMLREQVTARQRDKFITEFAIHRLVGNTVARRPYSKVDLTERLSTPAAQAALEESMAALRRILDSPTCDGIRDTAWGLFNAATQFADHHREAKTPETRFARTVLAPRDPLKVMAASVLREVVRTG